MLKNHHSKTVIVYKIQWLNVATVSWLITLWSGYPDLIFLPALARHVGHEICSVNPDRKNNEDESPDTNLFYATTQRNDCHANIPDSGPIQGDSKSCPL